MNGFKSAAAAVIASLLCLTPAKADIVYNLSFVGGGTGVLDLNLSTLSSAYNLNGNIAPYFVSLQINNVDGQNFLITTSNLGTGGYIQTGTAGQIYTLTVNEKAPTGVPDGTDYISVYTSSANVYSTPYGHGEASINFTINGPFVAAVPEPSTWAMLIAGFAAIGLLAYRRRNNAVLKAA
ncbi:PEP-CTERM sorting domain-containing protein [Bradyrhizobium lablabi]|nr:PEPxxWA-CTERM sorting domain-containing protein [Bradyrhizobium lablabi]MBR0697815.1 PEP-CTERM sorting domain-containing protein [Bradyrhizobium lablabi]